MDHNKPDLQHESLKKHPFGVPEGYFEAFPTRLQQRIREEESSPVPVRRFGLTTRRLAMAAAILGAALITTFLVKFSGMNSESNALYPDLALFEQLEVFDNDVYFYDYLDTEIPELNDDEAFVTQAVEYLAMNDVELDYLFEQ